MLPSAMDTHQLLDSLTAHIALYNSSIPNPSPGPRATVLRWFFALSAAQRQSALTVVDPNFVRVLLQMLSRLRRHGHGFFFLLPDLPSPSSSSLPSLCFRRSHGLLARAAADSTAELTLARSLRLFGSREEEQTAECPLDSLTVSEDLVADADRFVEVMDGISGGRFLRGEVNGLGAPWAELPWLKDKGYYSLEAFVANRMEVGLRQAWLSSHGGKKPKAGKAAKEKAGVAGVAANAFWRKKGCLDWWTGLDPGQRKKIFKAFLGKAAKSLANEIVKGSGIALRNEVCCCKLEAELQLRYGPTASWQRGKQSLSRRNPDLCLDIITAPSSRRPQTLAICLNKLLVAQEISTFLTYWLSEYEDKALFFSTVESVDTFSDCIIRKLRGLLMVVSINYINLELMGDVRLNAILYKSEEKSNVGCRRGKNKYRSSKKLSSIPKPSKDEGYGTDCAIDSSYGLCPPGKLPSIVDNQKTRTANPCVLKKDPEKETPLTKVEKEHAAVLADCKGHKSKKKGGRKGAKSKTPTLVKIGFSELENKKTAITSVAAESELAESLPSTKDSAGRHNLSPVSNFCDDSDKSGIVDQNEMMNTQLDTNHHSIANCCCTSVKCSMSSNKSDDHNSITMAKGSPQISSGSSLINSNICCEKLVRHINSSIICSGSMTACEVVSPSMPPSELETGAFHKKHEHCSSQDISDTSSQHAAPSNLVQGVMSENNTVAQSDFGGSYAYNHTSSMGGTSFEWPAISPPNFTSVNSQLLPAATDRLHLDVGHKWPSRFHQSFLPLRHQGRNPTIEGERSQILPSPTLPMSYDWPPMVKSYSRLSQIVTVNYDSGYVPRLQSSFCSGFATHGLQINGTSSENERKHPGDILDVCDLKNTSDLADDTESYWFSEEEYETHAFSGRDYNQFFGGGVMYWNPAEHVGTGLSRPPSHSSEDSAWAWHEADMNRTIDDMIGMPGLPASYNTNGLASPSAAPFCSPFDPLRPGHQSVSYSMPGNDINGKVLNPSSSVSDGPEEKALISVNDSPNGVEGMKGDTLPYSMLPPIIVPSISRRGSRSEFRVGHDHKSPCVSSTRRDTPHIKRPPSPVVLCVPRVPQPPPPSPVGESRKRGFPVVRSGSSSPRHWGMRSWYSDESNSKETRLCLDGAEVVWPQWRKKGLATSPMVQSIQGSLLQDHLITISHLARDQEHPDVALPLQPPDLLNCPSIKMSLSMMYNLLHKEIDLFCKQVAAENLVRKPYINWAVKRVTRSLQVLWPRSRMNIFGSNATGLALPTSDVDLVVSLPPVRNLEPIKEAGILEGRNGIKETCLQHAARYLANQDWVRSDSLKTIENTAIPVIMLVAEVAHDINLSNENSSIVESPEACSTKMPGKQSIPGPDLCSSVNTSWPMCSKMKKDDPFDVKSIHLDISFKSPSHTGLQTSELVRELTQQFPASVPLALILKKFLADRSLDHSYSGGLSSYCLVLLITRFLQHEHHIGRPVNQNLGSLLMDFLYFFGNVFDPRQMRISIQGSGVYMNRERGLSIDPIHIDDPLYPANNVGRNCFRVHQCIKAFADAYSVLENELSQFSGNCAPTSTGTFRILPKIIPSIGREE
ncbi:uncharacterized protein LOC103712263 isoform X2 [Phoenix dactylifera]|uniref:Uncharacterized protein LOC103712263 isoform X2 n=1 Tax=Phoenix dactylifera TaxID=42345 RepID=A0A8B8Z9P1_PHODC|nr:uncharacterized protein LOC103712263 isoform X2 [Phoenix dactylifera]